MSEQERKRLEALDRYSPDSSFTQQIYDDLTLLAAKTLKAPTASMRLLSEGYPALKSSYGEQLPPLSREDEFCAHTILNPLEATVVEDAKRDQRFRRSLLVRQAPFIRSYAGVPLTMPDSCVIGALSVMDIRPRRFTIDQIGVLRVLARQTVTQLELRRQTSLLSSANAKLQTLATSDSLTGLKNVRAFRQDLDAEILFAKRHGTPVSLIMLDVDNFKAYNDEFGHPAGDDILRAVSILLIDSSREYDFIARYGGEEFAMILRDADPAEAFTVAERLRINIASANWPDRPITASIGIATFSQRLNTRDLMISEADQLLYLSKTTGKNRVSQSHEDADADALSPRGHFSYL